MGQRGERGQRRCVLISSGVVTKVVTVESPRKWGSNQVTLLRQKPSRYANVKGETQGHIWGAARKPRVWNRVSKGKGDRRWGQSSKVGWWGVDCVGPWRSWRWLWILLRMEGNEKKLLVPSCCCWKMTTNWTAENITNLCSYSFGSQKSKMSFPGLRSRCRQGWLLVEAVWSLFPCLLQGLVDTWRHVTPSSVFKQRTWLQSLLPWARHFLLRPWLPRHPLINTTVAPPDRPTDLPAQGPSLNHTCNISLAVQGNMPKFWGLGAAHIWEATIQPLIGTLIWFMFLKASLAFLTRKDFWNARAETRKPVRWLLQYLRQKMKVI